jgi:hypothetical protein
MHSTRRHNSDRFPSVIALCGRAGAGKSAAAELLALHGYKTVKFATPLKNMLRALGLTERQIEGDQKEQPAELLGGKTPRQAMQTLGTEWGRGLIGDDLWIRAWSLEVERIVSRGGRVVVDDCRFENELAVALQYGRAVRINRPGLYIESTHQSETALDAVDMLQVWNTGTPVDLMDCILRTVTQ